MENLIAQFCSLIALQTSGMNTGACQAAINSSYIQTGGKTNYSIIETYYSKNGEALVRDNIDNRILYTAIGTYFVNDAYQKKEVKIQTPCNFFLCSSVNLDVGQNSQSYKLEWKWGF